MDSSDGAHEALVGGLGSSGHGAAKSGGQHGLISVFQTYTQYYFSQFLRSEMTFVWLFEKKKGKTLTSFKYPSYNTIVGFSIPADLLGFSRRLQKIPFPTASWSMPIIPGHQILKGRRFRMCCFPETTGKSTGGDGKPP